MNLKEQIHNLEMVYRARYLRYLRKYDENNNDMDAYGHAMECSFVLHEIFGLTDNEVRQLEKNDYAGILDKEMEGL